MRHKNLAILFGVVFKLCFIVKEELLCNIWILKSHWNIESSFTKINKISDDPEVHIKIADKWNIIQAFMSVTSDEVVIINKNAIRCVSVMMTFKSEHSCNILFFTCACEIITVQS